MLILIQLFFILKYLLSIKESHIIPEWDQVDYGLERRVYIISVAWARLTGCWSKLRENPTTFLKQIFYTNERLILHT